MRYCTASKGFTLIDLIVVMIILGILAAVAVPNYMTSMNQSAARAAQNNLITIYNAEKNFYLTNGYYCTTSTQNTTCADTLAHLNLTANLNLNITDNNFTTYACSDPNAATDSNNGSSFSCKATDPAISVSLKITNNPIVLTGGTACTTAAGASCNPVCSPSSSTYCP